MTFVRPGATVEAVWWETVPDKYEPVRRFRERAKAEQYADETHGRVSLILVLDGRDVRIPIGDEGWPESRQLRVGDTVRRTEYRLTPPSIGLAAEAAYPDLAAAIAAAPPGPYVWVRQVIWVGSDEVRLERDGEPVNDGRDE